MWNHINEEVISDLYSMDDCCQLKLVADETAGMKKTVPDESTGMKQTIKLIRASTHSKSGEVLVNWIILSTTSRLCSGSGGLTQTLLIKPNITYVLAKKKICLTFQLCLCHIIFCEFISNYHLKSIWCKIASIYKALRIFIQIPSKEMKVGDSSFYCGPYMNEFATDNASLYFTHLDFKIF